MVETNTNKTEQIKDDQLHYDEELTLNKIIVIIKNVGKLTKGSLFRLYYEPLDGMKIVGIFPLTDSDYKYHTVIMEKHALLLVDLIETSGKELGISLLNNNPKAFVEGENIFIKNGKLIPTKNAIQQMISHYTGGEEDTYTYKSIKEVLDGLIEELCNNPQSENERNTVMEEFLLDMVSDLGSGKVFSKNIDKEVVLKGRKNISVHAQKLPDGQYLIKIKSE